MKIDVIKTKKEGTVFRTLEDISFRMNRHWFRIDAGFRSDGMSVPRFLWRLIDPAITSKTLVPSIKHDWLYQRGVCTRLEADEFFVNELKKAGYPGWKRRLIYIGLRWFGWTHWKG